MSRVRAWIAGPVVVAAIGAAGLALAGTASAHVTVTAPGVTVGASDAAITFRVPDESATASTVGLDVQLPTDTPLAGVLVAPVPGWTTKITDTTLTTPITTDDGTITEVVSEITWTADSGSGIAPGHFGQFPIIAGQLPDHATSLTFKAVQTYSDGSQVAWIEEPAAGSTDEPDHPAPVLDLAAASGASTATNSTAPTVGARAGSDTATGAASPGSATTGIVLGAIGVVLGAAALGVSLTRGRRRGDPTTASDRDPA